MRGCDDQRQRVENPAHGPSTRSTLRQVHCEILKFLTTQVHGLVSLRIVTTGLNGVIIIPAPDSGRPGWIQDLRIRLYPEPKNRVIRNQGTFGQVRAVVILAAVVVATLDRRSGDEHGRPGK